MTNMLSECEQRLMIEIVCREVTWTTNGIYKNRQAFYRAIGRLKKSGLIIVIEKDGKHFYDATLKGSALARLIAGVDNVSISRKKAGIE